MFNSSEILFLALLGILLVGPKRLPVIARQFAGALVRLRQLKAELESQISRELNNITDTTGVSFNPALPLPQQTSRLSSTTTIQGDNAASIR